MDGYISFHIGHREVDQTLFGWLRYNENISAQLDYKSYIYQFVQNPQQSVLEGFFCQ